MKETVHGIPLLHELTGNKLVTNFTPDYAVHPGEFIKEVRI